MLSAVHALALPVRTFNEAFLMNFPFTLSPHARRSGNGWVDRCPAHNDHNPSLSIARGTDGRLLLHCFNGCSYADILAAAGVTRQVGARQPSYDVMRQQQTAATLDTCKRRARASAIWRAAGPIEGSLSQTYLQARGLSLWSQNQRHHAALYYSPTGQKLPALVCKIIREDQAVGVHRTFLDNCGKKLAKMMLGDCRGGAVRLSEGKGALVVAEGIETTMSIMQLGLTAPNSASYWAALSATNMAKLILPSRPGHLIVATDGDPAGRNAGNLLASRASSLGWTVSSFPAPEGRDWNDVLLMNEPQA